MNCKNALNETLVYLNILLKQTSAASIVLFYAAAVSSPQHFLLKNLVTCLCMVNYHYLLTRILLHEKAPGCPRDLEKNCKNSKKLHALKYLKL